MKKQKLNVKLNNIFLGGIEEDNQLQKIVVCVSLDDDKMLNLENLKTYPHQSYIVKRGVIHYPTQHLIKLINLSYLCNLMGYQEFAYDEMQSFVRKVTPEFILDLLNEKERKINSKTVTYLKEIYYLLKLNEENEKGKNKQCQQMKRIYM